MTLTPRTKASRSTTSRKRLHSRRGFILHVEALECRTVPTYFNPAQMRHAYGFDQIADDGAGQTIAIVDAYDNPKFVSSTDPGWTGSDLYHFDHNGYGGFTVADPPSFTKVNQSGGTSYPALNTGWA